MPRELEQLIDNEQDGLSGLLSRVSAAVLETMFFTDAVPAACSHGWLRSAIGTRVRFEGPRHGEMLASFSLGAARSIAPAFLGLDSDQITESQRTQVILELANILCGAALSSLWPRSHLTLDSPELLDSAQDAEGAAHRCFRLPEGMLAVSMHFRDGGGSAQT